MEFFNRFTKTTLTYEEFVQMVWGIVEDGYDGAWDNLTREEQITLYCKNVEYQLKYNSWEYYGVQ